MLLMVENGIRGGICLDIHRYAKANSKYMKNYDRNKELSNLNLYRRAMSQKLFVSSFKWVKNASKFNEDFIRKAIMKIVMKDIFLQLMLNILKNYMIFTMIYLFCLKEWKLKLLTKLQPTCMIKNNMLFT